MKNAILFLFVLSSISLNAQETKYKYFYKVLPNHHFEDATPPAAPDYSNSDHWAALPEKEDFADKAPPFFKNKQATATADVFFVHPTTYMGKMASQWNGPVDDAKLNKKTDETTIKYQASAFNGSGKIYAPRYRQAHVHAYHNKNPKYTKDMEKALLFAYADVKAAFEYYLEHYNDGRPIFITSHSQGSSHAEMLLNDFFGPDSPIADQLVVGYLIGMPINKKEVVVPICETPEQTGCYCSWQTFGKGYFPKWHYKKNDFAVTNPLSWTTTKELIPASKNSISVLKNFDKPRTNVCDAQIHEGVIWITRLNIPGAFLLRNKNWHIADINLFYGNIRENMKTRLQSFEPSQQRTIGVK